MLSKLCLSLRTARESARRRDLKGRRRQPLLVESVESRLLLTATVIPQVLTLDNWLGTTSSVWSDGTNWSLGIAPGASNIAVITAQTNNPDVTASTIIGGLQFNGGSITVDSGKSLEVLGDASLAPSQYTSLAVISSSPTALQVDGNLTIPLNSLYPQVSTGLAAGSTIAVKGNVTSNPYFGGAGVILLNGSGTQTVTGGSDTTFDGLPGVTIAQPGGGSVSLVGNIGVSGNWTRTSGTVNAVNSDVLFQGANQTVTSDGMSFYDVTVSPVQYTSLSVGGSKTMTVTDDLTILPMPPNSAYVQVSTGLAAGSTIAVAGNVTDSNPYFGGAGTILLNGAAASNQTLTGTASLPAGGLPSVTINSHGTVAITGNLRVSGNWLQSSGTMNPDPASTVIFNGPAYAPQTITVWGGSGNSFGGLTIGSTGTYSTVTSITGFKIGGNFNLDATGGNDTFKAPGNGQSGLTVAGSFQVIAGTFNANAGRVTLAAAGSVTYSAPGVALNDLYINPTVASSTITVVNSNASTPGLSVNGTLVVTGNVAGVQLNGGTIEAKGNVTTYFAQAFAAGSTASFLLDGTTNQTLTGYGYLTNVEINNPTGAINLAANAFVTIGGNLAVDSGSTLNINGGYLKVVGTKSGSGTINGTIH